MICCPLWIASGQTTTATLFGVVHDNSGAVIPEAKITARNTATSCTRTVSSNDTGAYLITNLPLGPYSLLIEKEGFKATDVKQAEVQTGRNSSISIKMELGSSSTVVEVSGAAVTVDTTSTATDSNLTDTFYQSIPVGRGVTGLFYAAPGVASGGGTGTALISGSVSSVTLTNSGVGVGNTAIEGRPGGTSPALAPANASSPASSATTAPGAPSGSPSSPDRMAHG
jgi:hypothetical protein